MLLRLPVRKPFDSKQLWVVQSIMGGTTKTKNSPHFQQFKMSYISRDRLSWNSANRPACGTGVKL
jgi:hypothetical protein